MIPFILFIHQLSMYSFHESLTPFTLPNTPFRQFDPIISSLSFTICFAIRKLSFFWLGSFRSLAHSFCFFLFAKEITLFMFYLLLILLPCLCQFFFFPISIHFLLFHYCFSNFLIPPPCFLMPVLWAFWQTIIFFICCVHLHPDICTLLPHLIFDHALVFFTCFSSLSFHTCTLCSNFLHHPFIVLNHMSITHNLCFGTHFSFRMTLTLRTFALASCRTII